MSSDVRFDKKDTLCEISLTLGDETVGRAEVQDKTMRLAGAWVRMGGIANVVTHPAHRGQGYGTRLMKAALAYMREEEYPISILFGISDYYHRFAYTPVLPEYEVSVATRDAERREVTATVRPARAEEQDALLDLYTRVNAHRTGTLRRTVAKFRPLPEKIQQWWFHARRVLVAEQAGTLTGYVILSGEPGQFRVSEVVVPAEHVATAGASLVASLAQEAVQRRLERIRLPLPPDEALAGLLRQMGCRMEVRYPANGDGMGRIVHLEALAEALTPALAGRLETLPPSERPGSLEFICSNDRAHIALGNGRTLSIALPQQPLCQLVMGYRGIDELATEWPDAVAPDDIPTVRTLFPAGYPHIWDLDHF